MGLHIVHPSQRRRRKGNYFGDGSLGMVRISSAGAQQSFDGGVTYSGISGWTLVGSVVSIPSTTDGDMVVLNCKTLQVDAGMTLTVANRCRGLLVYSQGAVIINGIISMTARGCHANPAESSVTTDTPVAPTDGHAVPTDGITIRRFAAGIMASDIDDDLLWGCGAAAMAAEAKQPKVPAGLVVRIPRVGGAGGQQANGGTMTNAPGGGGSGYYYNKPLSYGVAGTCYGGGSAGAGDAAYGDPTAPKPYGGAGGIAGCSSTCNALGGGAGNPAGTGIKGGYAGVDGTGGLLMLIVGGALSGAGSLEAKGSAGGPGGYQCGGGSGGGVALALYAGTNTFTGSLTANGGPKGCSGATVGDGGAGAVIGPTKIDPA